MACGARKPPWTPGKRRIWEFLPESLAAKASHPQQWELASAFERLVRLG